jgi:hypothetical protein
MTKPRRPKRTTSLTADPGPALRRAAKEARRIAKMHGTAICVLKDGKLVMIRP